MDSKLSPDAVSEVIQAQQPGNMINDLQMIKQKIIDTDKKLGELILEKRKLMEVVQVAQELISEIVALGGVRLDTPIELLAFSSASRMAIIKALNAYNIKTLGELADSSAESLTKSPTLAKATEEIRHVLAKHGLELQ